MKEDLDRLLAYRNFLAAEDHLDELLYSPESSEEQSFLTGIKNEIEYLRDDVMPKEVNQDFHCVVKHLSTAYEACREVAKATHETIDIDRANACRGLLNTVLERLWGRKIITCERCKLHGENNGRIQEEGSRDTAEAFVDGLTGNGISGVSSDRIISVPSSEASYGTRSEADEFESDFAGRETEAPF